MIELQQDLLLQRHDGTKVLSRKVCIDNTKEANLYADAPRDGFIDKKFIIANQLPIINEERNEENDGR
jgi:hypothetical protein